MSEKRTFLSDVRLPRELERRERDGRDVRPGVPWLLAAIAGLLLVYSALALYVPPTMFPDCGWGFRVWQDMSRGSPWNVFQVPAPENIARDRAVFQAAWSPGQYALPGFFADRGMSLGHALTLVTLMVTALGLWGWYQVYRVFGFTTHQALLTCLVIASVRSAGLPFGVYNGGDLLLFGAVPWILRLSLALRALELWQTPLLFAAFVAGWWLKHSFLIAGAAIATTLFLLRWPERRGPGSMLRYGLGLAIVLGGAYAFSYWAYTSRGWTGVEYRWQVAHPLAGWLFPISAPLLGAFSIGDLLNRVLEYSGRKLFSYYQSPLVLGVLALVAGLVVRRVLAAVAARSYRSALIAFLAVYGVVFATLFTTGAPVDPQQERHYRPAALVLLPGVLAWVSGWRRFSRNLAWACVALLCLYGVSSYFFRIRQNSRHGVVGRLGFTQNQLDRPALAVLREIDRNASAASTLVYVTGSQVALELAHARVLSMDADFATPSALAAQRYRGRVDNLFVLLPAKLVANGKNRLILGSFVSYGSWDSLSLPSHRLYFPREQRYRPRLRGAGLESPRVPSPAVARAR